MLEHTCVLKHRINDKTVKLTHENNMTVLMFQLGSHSENFTDHILALKVWQMRFLQ